MGVAGLERRRGVRARPWSRPRAGPGAATLLERSRMLGRQGGQRSGAFPRAPL